jgi:hypothetical protein
LSGSQPKATGFAGGYLLCCNLWHNNLATIPIMGQGDHQTTVQREISTDGTLL